jgi:alkylated DNA repair dioxygenase AlkB
MPTAAPDANLPRSCDRGSLSALAGALARLRDVEALSLPWLSGAACKSFLEAAAGLPYREARAVVGAGEREVRQDFEVCFEDLGTEGPFHRFASDLEADLKAAASQLPPPSPHLPPHSPAVLPDGFRLNDLIVQRYKPGSSGITPHVDHIRYQGIVAIVVFSGEADFQILDDRQAGNPRSVANRAGDLLLMRAPGFAGLRDRPFHRLCDVRSPRVILGLRWDSQAEPGP